MSTSYLLDSSVLVLSLKQDKATHQHLAEAAAIQYGLTLAARDHHFTWIAGLSLEQW